MDAAANAITTRQDRVGTLLNEWAAAGSAAGLRAITYENRDDGHSMLPMHFWPGLKTHEFTAEEKRDGLVKGPARKLREVPTIGNCSMAAPADRGGSLARLFFMQPDGARFLAAQYLSNQLFIYPEHRDHDPGGNGQGDGWGDLYPLNSPSVLISQGSSGSDQALLRVALSTLAAFPPDTQRQLIEHRLLMPTVQQILRRHNRVVESDEDYLSGKAHPVVFADGFLDEEKMVNAAHAMLPGAIPPLALIEVLQESAFEPGAHFFEPAEIHPHKLADTPVACARVFRGNLSEYELTVSAAKSLDLMKRPLKLRVVVLQGDASQVRIDYNPERPLAKLTLRWQPPALTTCPEATVRSHRVDVGFFVDNGVSLSPPAILSVYMLPNERRFYDEQGRVTEIHYAARNPDLGLPVGAGDSRWLSVLAACARAPEGLRGTLMERAFEPEEMLELRVMLNELETLQQRAEKLEKEAAGKEEAVKARRKFEDTLRARLDSKLPGTRRLSVRRTIETAFHAITKFTDLYPGFQTEIDRLAQVAPAVNAMVQLRTEVTHLMDLGILLRTAEGLVAALNDEGTRSEAENDALKAVNLTVLSHALYPEALQRKTGPAWVDPRLATIKPWRDVLRYDESGERTGWTRHQGGRITWFDAQGRWLPDGPGKDARAVPVRYEPDGSAGLKAVPVAQ